MLLATIPQHEEHTFQIDRRRGLHLVFASKTAQSGPQPFMPHWVGTFADEDSFRAGLRWVGVRRSEWQSLGAKAQRMGPRAFAKHMNGLIKKDPLAEVTATMVKRMEDPFSVGFGETLMTKNGLRFELLYVHQFAAPELRELFYDWLYSNEDALELPAALVAHAYNDGTTSLGTLLDETVEGYKPPTKRRSRKQFAEAMA